MTACKRWCSADVPFSNVARLLCEEAWSGARLGGREGEGGREGREGQRGEEERGGERREGGKEGRGGEGRGEEEVCTVVARSPTNSRNYFLRGFGDHNFKKRSFHSWISHIILL